MIFACLVQFVYTIPACSYFTIAGVRLSDKTFTYLASLNLLLMGGVPSMLAGGGGICAGLLYRANMFGLRKVRLPRFVVAAFSRTLGALLQERRTSARAAQGAARRGVPPRSRGGSPAAAAAAAMPPPAAAAPLPPAEAVNQLVEMGFDRSQAVHALQVAGNNVDMAIGVLVG
mmetsp:Transcript_191/g.503  ORF Transcript_191/g.503 Transcript_191/m.503 type:complete len:173 (-) Transcript_191:120-638(-)